MAKAKKKSKTQLKNEAAMRRDVMMIIFGMTMGICIGYALNLT